MTTLKIPFSSSLAISFCLDAVYWAGSASVFLINIPDLSIRKQISDGAAIWPCFGYFLDHLQFCLIRAREAKVAESDLALYSIGGLSAGDVSVWGVSAGTEPAKDFSAGGTYIDVELSDTSS